jgi:hypothetical protein
MLTDQGCQTNAPDAKAFVSSCHEWWIGQKLFNGQLNESPLEFIPFFKRMSDIECVVRSHTFRIYGELRQDGSRCIVLATEFIVFDEQHDLIDILESVVNQTGAHVWFMQDDYHVDHRFKGQDDNGNRVGETFGPDHGKPFKQIELSWRIEHKTLDQIEQLCFDLTKKTREVWASVGVEVW